MKGKSLDFQKLIEEKGSQNIAFISSNFNDFANNMPSINSEDETKKETPLAKRQIRPSTTSQIPIPSYPAGPALGQQQTPLSQSNDPLATMQPLPTDQKTVAGTNSIGQFSEDNAVHIARDNNPA
jgi:hypothetical protein